MAQYLLSMVQPGTGDEGVPPPEVLEEIMRRIGAIREELRSQGSWVFGNGLEAPATATVVRPGGDGVSADDGPFQATDPHVGGITIIDVADRAEAIARATRYVGATTLTIEVRPFRHPVPD